MAGNKVMVVDDDPVIRQLLEVNLQLEGFETASAYDGQMALDIVKDVNPDLVILDIMMPKHDGLEVCRRMKADPETAHLPIIFLSAKAQDLDVRRGVEMGVAAYLTKPFDPVELLDTVQRVLAGETLLPDR